MMGWGIQNTTAWVVSWFLIPAFIFLVLWSHRRRIKNATRFGDLKLVLANLPDSIWKQPSDEIKNRSGDPAQRLRLIRRNLRYREISKVLMMMIALLAILTAMGRPQWGTRQEIVHQMGIDLVLCVDTSESMRAQDVAPDRLNKARSIINSLLSQLDGNRVGLVGFATTTRLHCPLTLDYRGLRSILDYCLTLGPGTDIEAAVAACLRVLQNSEARSRAIIIISDGEDHGGNIEKAIDMARSNGVRIYTVGVGTLEGSPIPEGDTGSQGYKKKDGELVWTKMEESVLVQLADKTGGRYFRASPEETEARILASEIRNLETTEFSQTMTTRQEDQFGIFLLLALLFLSMDCALDRIGTIRWEDRHETV
ncbi:VWA domain-containing protein [bacterium]|nr:VWA domain-containing protein [candidate division CSSED10-310 bacterium]